MSTLNLEYIKSRRTTLELTLQDVADSLGMKNASTYLKYETGVYAFKAEHLPRLAKILRCSITDFFTRNVAI